MVQKGHMRERRWSIVTGQKDRLSQDALREVYERIVRRAMVALDQVCEDSSAITDDWLDRLCETSPYSNGNWGIQILSTASAAYCDELRTRCLEARDENRASVWADLARQFGELPDPRMTLHAIRRSTPVGMGQTEKTAEFQDANEQRQRSPDRQGKSKQAEVEPSGKRRLSGSVDCPWAARRMEAFLEENGIGPPEFAGRVKTTERTLRSFRRSGRIRREIFKAIAEAMGTTPEALLKP